jgi:DNA gyrase subunit A
MRVAIEVRRDVPAHIVLNQLYKMTPMENTFGVIMLALVDGRPRVLSLKACIQNFIDHRHEVVVRRTRYDLNRAERRAHIVEGLRIALDSVDKVIDILRKSSSVEEASQSLTETFRLTQAQVDAVLDMRLQRLTATERARLEEEYRGLVDQIGDLRDILDNQPRRMRIIKDEMIDLKNRFGDERRTQIMDEEEEFSIEDLIADEEMVITISHTGYIKRIRIDTYRRQGRGGKGVTGMTTKEEDFVEHLFIASTHTYILFFTNRGKCYWMKVYEIPEGGRAARGKAIVNLLELDPGEKIAAFLPIREFDDEHYVMMATREGYVKKTVLSAYGNPRRTGILAINIREGDELIAARLTDGNNDIVIASRQGQAIRFHESEVRDMGRDTQGVKGIQLEPEDIAVGMVTVRRDGTLLVVTENGFGKRTDIDDYRITHRAGKGVINIKTSERNGMVVSIREVIDDDELMIITMKGVVIRLPIREVRIIGRNTQGVRLNNVGESDKVVDVAPIAVTDDEEDEDALPGNGAPAEVDASDEVSE